MARQQKKKVGRPRKGPGEKTVRQLTVGFNANLSKALDAGCKNLKRETGGLVDINAQRLLQILVEQLARDLKRKSFSILSVYLDTKNGGSN